MADHDERLERFTVPLGGSDENADQGVQIEQLVQRADKRGNDVLVVRDVCAKDEVNGSTAVPLRLLGAHQPVAPLQVHGGNAAGSLLLLLETTDEEVVGQARYDIVGTVGSEDMGGAQELGTEDGEVASAGAELEHPPPLNRRWAGMAEVLAQVEGGLPGPQPRGARGGDEVSRLEQRDPVRRHGGLGLVQEGRRVSHVGLLLGSSELRGQGSREEFRERRHQVV